ncbi:MAG: glycogen/starch synthase [Flavobacteriaceae bacterium]
MKDKRVLIISSEVVPYLPQTEQAVNAFAIPKSVNEHGGQTRIFIPRYGMINERRHQLHEVIRLSGMNLVINDMDTPLIIKVASIPKERMQVYFIDNEEYFKRKAILKDENGTLFADNDERMLFFTKGVVETVKKLNWSPDIIHLHGWFTSLFPLYLKTLYKDEPLFEHSKIISSIYPQEFEGTLAGNLHKKIAFDQIEARHIEPLKKTTYENLLHFNATYSDGFVLAGEKLPKPVLKAIEASDKPILSYTDSKEDGAVVAYYSQKILS